MSLFIATGTNLGDRKANLAEARYHLCKHFKLISESRIYESPAIDYLNQPDFYNQVLEFYTPVITPEAVMDLLLQIEKDLGRNRLIPKGPRIIDLDILFYDEIVCHDEKLTLPHPRLFERSFVVLPLSELPGFSKLKSKYPFKFIFDNSASPIS